MIATTEISIESYHASEFVSHSKLIVFDDEGPFVYHARYLTPDRPKKPRTKAQKFGQAYEDFVQLPPDVFASRWKELPSIEGKATDEQLEEAAALGLLSEDGKPFSKRHAANTVAIALDNAKSDATTLSREEFVRIERMAESFARNADAQGVIKGLRTQVTLRLDNGGLDMLPGLQSRPDWYGDSIAPDLKTTSKFATFDNEIAKCGYDTQAAFIDIVAGDVEHLHPLIVCESEWPFRCQVIDIPHSMIVAGHEWVVTQLDALRQCYARDEWPLCETRRMARTPRWKAQKEEW